MTETQNPFLTAYHTPHETVPFHLIRLEHYEPAILKGMEEQNREIETIVNNPEEPTFQNTIVALERSGDLLNRVSTVFGNLLSAETNDEMDALAEKVGFYEKYGFKTLVTPQEGDETVLMYYDLKKFVVSNG